MGRPPSILMVPGLLEGLIPRKGLMSACTVEVPAVAAIQPGVSHVL